MKGLFHSSNGDPQKYLYMTQAERDAYSYELARSPEAARNFLKNLDAALNYRVDAAGQEREENSARNIRRRLPWHPQWENPRQRSP